MDSIDIFIYITDLPDGINEMVAPCADGYTIYIDSRLDEIERYERLRHAINHIRNNDFNKSSVAEIENEAHKEVG